jgi:hypothetical protein
MIGNPSMQTSYAYANQISCHIIKSFDAENIWRMISGLDVQLIETIWRIGAMNTFLRQYVSYGVSGVINSKPFQNPQFAGLSLLQSAKLAALNL